MSKYPELRIHEKFTLALDQFQKLLADQDDPRAQQAVRTVSIESQYHIAPGHDNGIPDAPLVRCSDPASAEKFGQLLYTMNATLAHLVRFHFIVSNYTVVGDEWDVVVENEAARFRMNPFAYVEQLQKGVDHITELL